MKSTYYGVLNVATDASNKAIEEAYRELARQYHPDRNPQNREECDDNMKAINAARDVLSDPDKRRAYDDKLRGGAPQVTARAQQQPNTSKCARPDCTAPAMAPFALCASHFYARRRPRL